MLRNVGRRSRSSGGRQHGEDAIPNAHSEPSAEPLHHPGAKDHQKGCQGQVSRVSNARERTVNRVILEYIDFAAQQGLLQPASKSVDIAIIKEVAGAVKRPRRTRLQQKAYNKAKKISAVELDRARKAPILWYVGWPRDHLSVPFNDAVKKEELDSLTRVTVMDALQFIRTERVTASLLMNAASTIQRLQGKKDTEDFRRLHNSFWSIQSFQKTNLIY